MSDDAARTADGRLFYARGAATENDRSPRVDRLTGGTIKVAVFCQSINQSVQNMFTQRRRSIERIIWRRIIAIR